MAADDAAPGRVSFDVDVDDDRTTITVAGEREVAVVVVSASGERVYLPPENDDDGPARPAGDADSPYDAGGGASASPYDGVADESPYDAGRTTDDGERVPTADGFRIYHPEPATDVHLLR